MIEKIEALYEEIPPMICKPGCTKCCGLIPWSKAEYDRLKDKKDMRFLCVYPHNGRCSIYDQRPFMCRLFGTVAPPHMLACPKGCLPAFPLTGDQAKDLLSRYKAIVGDKFYIYE